MIRVSDNWKQRLRLGLIALAMTTLAAGALAHDGKDDEVCRPVTPHINQNAMPRVAPQAMPRGRMNPIRPGSAGVNLYLGGAEAGKMDAAAASPLGMRAVEEMETRIAARTPGKGNGPISYAASKKALVLYDSQGDTFWMGKLYAQHMANLLSHFGWETGMKPVEQYVAGDTELNNATFYFGIYYNNPLPEAFKSDAITTTKPLMWCGYNLWQVAWTPDWMGWNPDFENKYGFRFNYLDGSVVHDTVMYKGTALTKETFDPVVSYVSVTNALIAEEKATLTKINAPSTPYIVKGANLYYVADNPLTYVSWITNMDRSLAVYDLLHDMTGSTASQNNKAFIRIEDVHPMVDVQNLRALADVMKAENVPFVICVIPYWMDPLGYENDGVPYSITMDKKAAFVNALKYCVTKGGQILMHGYTHQYGNIANPYNGTSGPDFEFFRVSVDEFGYQKLVGPVAEDSAAWVNDRLNKGMALLKKAGNWVPAGWVTPHYLASPLDYTEFAKKYNYSFCRGLYFATTADGQLRYLQQKVPYPVKDTFGMKRFPETIGYVDLDGFAQQPATTEQDLIFRAGVQKVVRDGWAGMYFHWFHTPARLRTLLRGVKAQGYTFQNITTTTSILAATN